MAVSGLNVTTGLGNGLDVGATVDALIQAQSGPLTQMQSTQQTMQSERVAISSLATQLWSLKSASDTLRDIGGAFDGVSTSSTNNGVVSVSADATAQPGKHTIVVNSLASASAYYTAEQPSATSALTQGSFQLQIGSTAPQTVTIDSSNNTLAGIAKTVNGLGLGVQASVLQDSNGARLTLSSTTSGAGSDINIASDTEGLGFIKSSTGADASYSVDGVPLNSASNAVTGVLQGITLNLVAAAPGQPVTITASPDIQGAQTALENFVSAYNSLTQAVNAQFAVDSTGKAGILSGDISVRQLQQELLSDASLSGTGPSAYTTLRSLGVEMQNDGTLQINQTTLNAALNSNFADVKSMFQDSGNYGQQLGTDLIQATDPTLGVIGSDGSGLDNQIKTMTGQMQTFNDYLDQQRIALTDKYNKISVMMQQEPAQLAQIQALLGSTASSKTS